MLVLVSKLFQESLKPSLEDVLEVAPAAPQGMVSPALLALPRIYNITDRTEGPPPGLGADIQARSEEGVSRRGTLKCAHLLEKAPQSPLGESGEPIIDINSPGQVCTLCQKRP